MDKDLAQDIDGLAKELDRVGYYLKLQGRITAVLTSNARGDEYEGTFVAEDGFNGLKARNVSWSAEAVQRAWTGNPPSRKSYQGFGATIEEALQDLWKRFDIEAKSFHG